MRKKFAILLLILVLFPTCFALLKSGFFPTHDYIYIARIFELDKALKAGHFPVRWAADFRYGEATFNFYAPLVYYLGSLIHTFGLSFLNTTKILFGLSFILSGLAMYFLGKDLWHKPAGILMAVLYVYAPYRAVDVYIRGAISEAWAFVFLPLIFLFAKRMANKNQARNMVFLALSLAGLFYTHNILTLLFPLFTALWYLFLVWKKKDLSLVKNYFLATLLGVGLAASFLLPAFWEKKFVQTSHLTQGYFDFRAHFVAIKQWFITKWGYGASLWGPVDDLSFQIGVGHWIVLGLSAIVYLVYLIKPVLIKSNLIKLKKLTKEGHVVYWLFVGGYLLSLFLQHNKSTFIWEKISLLQFIQFPWRFLAISVFFVALIGGWLVNQLGEKCQQVFVALAVIGILLLNFGYFRPEKYYLDSVDEHYIDLTTILYRNDKVPKDYLPIWAEELKDDRVPIPKNFKYQGKTAQFEVDQPGEIEVPVTYFPGWVEKKGLTIKPSKLGLIIVEIPEGINQVQLEFKNTPIRTAANIITLVSFLGLIYLYKNEKLV